MRRLEIVGLNVVVPDDWGEVTKLQPAPVATLQKSGGVGLLQFSVATYESGVLPNIQGPELVAMLSEMLSSKGIAPASPIRELKTAAGLHCASATSFSASEFVVAWCLSDGLSVAFITWLSVSQWAPEVSEEMTEASQIVSRITFRA